MPPVGCFISELEGLFIHIRPYIFYCFILHTGWSQCWTGFSVGCRANIQRRTTVQPHNHTYGQFRAFNSPLHVLGLEKSPHAHGENMHVGSKLVTFYPSHRTTTWLVI
ncbi:hypothetical protein JOB18_019749 [Solea senegalensis]|uniref:Uncharacterized protein n=1 Tax=Solea senegalensis TaxID=28829 RepID=A0AAV6R0E0_SOLSE|nr:hypothetical protein JOB18_019749 [Solea senegalensis]